MAHGLADLAKIFAAAVELHRGEGMTEQSPAPVRNTGALADALGQVLECLLRLGIASASREHQCVRRLVRRCHVQLPDQLGEGRAIRNLTPAILCFGSADKQRACLHGTDDMDDTAIDIDIFPFQRARLTLTNACLC